MPARRRAKTPSETLAAYEERIGVICDRVESSGLRVRQASELAFSAAQGVPTKFWNVLSVMGKMLQAYEARFHQSFKSGTTLQWELYDGLSKLVLEYGAEDVADGIDVIFSPEMRWVDSPAWAFLRPAFFEKHVLPRVHNGRTVIVGEQAEAMSIELSESREVTL
jgi:hypothetical protein